MRVGQLKMAIFASFVHCLPNVLHTWPHDSFQMIRQSMTLGIFQGHWTVSHQISQKRCVIRQKLLQTTNRKSYTSFRLVPLLMTLKYFEGHFNLGCHFHVHFSNPWHAFASHGLPAIDELLVSTAKIELLPGRLLKALDPGTYNHLRGYCPKVRCHTATEWTT